MAKYRKKPVVIDAFRMGIDDIPDWFMEKVDSDDVLTITGSDKAGKEETWCEIETLEGVMVGNQGDYIIKGIAGEIYPCKPDIFEASYERVE